MKLFVRIPLLALAFFSLQASAAEPMWIWKAGKITTEKANFKKSFALEALPKKASIKVTCDNSFNLSINGKAIASSSEWQSPIKMDVAKYLKVGENELTVQASNEGAMGGFILSLDMAKQRVVTDKSWMAQAPKGEWHPAVEISKYGAGPWQKVFDNAAASSRKGSSSPATIPVTTLPGFKAEKIYEVNKATQGSWVGMTVDPKGRIIATDQYGGVYRITVTPDVSVEKLKVKVTGGHGALYAFGSLYIMVGEGQRGLHRLQDTNGDDQYDKEEYLIPFKAGGEHGTHSLVLSPDKQSIYLIQGNNSDMPESASRYRMAKAWDEDHILPRMPDGRGHNNGRMAPGGFIMKVSPDAKIQEVICHGFRNEFDAAFNLDGELFAFDADMEYDIGSPWYRPTRVNHVVSGVDWGWRHGTGKWPDYYTDTLPATIDIGPGSPTGVSNGLGAKFPAKYQKAIYINDWTYGTMYAIHLEQEGGSYKATKEEFVSGKPLPLTDVTIHPDGNMYFMAGGRRTTSALYRLRYVGKESTAPVSAGAISPLLELRRELEALHEEGVGETAIAKALPSIGHTDRFIRYAARVALEKQPVAKWQDQLDTASTPWAVIELATGVARMGSPDQQPRILKALNKLNYASMKPDMLLAALRSYQLAFTRLGKPAQASDVIATLNPHYPHADNMVNRELSQVLLYLNAPGAVSRTVQLVLSANDTQEKILDEKVLQRNDGYASATRRTEQFRPNVQQFALAFSLHSITEGWTEADRASYFSWFPRAKTWQGGNSFGIFIENARKQALANVSDETLRKKYDAVSSKSLEAPRAVETPKGPGRAWTMAEALKAVDGQLTGRNFDSGENLFHATACASCHRFAEQGMGIGPDLTGASSRYTLSDMLENIIEPSKVISDQYVSTAFTLKDGSQVIGRVGEEKDGILHLMTNPYSAETTVELKKSDVKSQQAFEVSHMPPGLINSLNPGELADLIAYIFSAGDPNHAYFVGAMYQPEIEGAESLFNGEDLSGWMGNSKLWTVEDGVIKGNTHETPITVNTFLVWDGEVEDFHLAYEAKSEGVNSGMMYRSDWMDKAVFRLRGYQADMHPKPEYMAMLYGEQLPGRGIIAQRGQRVEVGTDGNAKVVGTTSEVTPVALNEWQSYEIICRGNHLVHKLNGDVTVDVTDHHPEKLLKGLIGMQLHVGGEMTCHFRNIRLKRL
ncbi:MAG: putative heme-binding domain-containing protein [Kiritimatiellia bacterium]|jgi:putative heme-binding domain-containing protein